MDDSHGNRLSPHTPDRYKPTIKKVRAASVPYGESISRNGQTLWVALDGERVVCVAATAGEAKRKFKEIQRGLGKGSGEGVTIYS